MKSIDSRTDCFIASSRSWFKPIGIQKSSVSPKHMSNLFLSPGISEEPFLRTVSRTVPRREPSNAVSATSPSPWTKWGSPAKKSAPFTSTGRYNVEPKPSSLISRFPPSRVGGIELSDSSEAFATPIIPRNGNRGNVISCPFSTR